jgi:hypothetical protein
MEIKKSDSTDTASYEILIRKRGESDYASYCPQLNLIIKGSEHEAVANEMRLKVDEHINKLLGK